MDRLVILGAGGLSREVFFHVRDLYPKCFFIFVDEFSQEKGLQIGGGEYPIVSDWDFSCYGKALPFLIGVGIPKIKRLLVEKALAAELVPAETLVHPLAHVQDAILGRGGVICPGVMATTNIIVEDYVVLNLTSTVGHDAIIRSYVTCNPLSSISGNCTLNEGVLLGGGAFVKEGVSIAKNTVIGAQSFVSKNITQEGATYVGVPARILQKKS